MEIVGARLMKEYKLMKNIKLGLYHVIDLANISGTGWVVYAEGYEQAKNVVLNEYEWEEDQPELATHFISPNIIEYSTAITIKKPWGKNG